MEVTGNVESERGINLEGEVIISGNLDAYGPLTMNGSISCEYVSPLKTSFAVPLCRDEMWRDVSDWRGCTLL
jgi:hypothetical protein